MNFNQVLKGASIVLVSSTLAAVSISANAESREFKDSTTCYLLKQGKLVSKSKCSYEGSFTSNTSINYIGYSFKLPNNNAKLTVDRTLDYNTSQKKLELNEKPAVMHFRYDSSLKVIPKNIAAKFETGAPKGTLSCVKEKASAAWEICAPFDDVRFEGL
ncbi:hypothetical protein [Psychrobacter sanguinis]|uniref:hypothetical protein n=1 Tax=Psychrobacter sanguinis TaxID=861445 RepID=UPI0028AD58F0|nr:hypothetical protein [Psychrobacter sanguinis]